VQAGGQLFGRIGVVVPGPGAVRVVHPGLVEQVLVVVQVPGVLPVGDGEGGAGHGVGVHPGDLLTELTGDVGDVHELTAVLGGEEVLQVLHHVQVGGATCGQVGDHLRVVVVRPLLHQVDGHVRVLLVE